MVLSKSPVIKEETIAIKKEKGFPWMENIDSEDK